VVCVCVCVCLQCDFSLIFLVSYERTLSYLDKHVLLARAFIQRHCSVKRLNSLHLITVRGVNLVQNVGGRPVQGVWGTEVPQWSPGAKPR